MKMKMRFRGVAGVSYFSEDIARFHVCTGFYTDRERLQVGVVPKLVVPVIDNDKIAAGRLNVRGLSRNILSHVAAHSNDRSVSCCEHFLAVCIVIGIVSSVPLVTFSIRSDLQKIICERFRKKPLVGVEISML